MTFLQEKNKNQIRQENQDKTLKNSPFDWFFLKKFVPTSSHILHGSLLLMMIKIDILWKLESCKSYEYGWKWSSCDKSKMHELKVVPEH